MYLKSRNQFFFSVFMFYFYFRYSSLANDSLEAFFTRVEFHKLEGIPIQTIFVNSVFKCCWKCQRFPDCVALNIVVQPNQNGLYECVLLRHEKDSATTPLTASLLHHHYTLPLMSPSGPTHLPGGQWNKINTSPVCFGTKDSAFGRFYIKQNMTVTSIMLVHLSGYVTCTDQHESSRSNWGCGFYTNSANVSFEDRLYTIITDHQDHKILPQDEFIRSVSSLSYNLPDGTTSKSPELFFPNFTTPMNVAAGQEYRIWYGQDLVNKSEENNEGNVCAEVYLYGKQL